MSTTYIWMHFEMLLICVFKEIKFLLVVNLINKLIALFPLSIIKFKLCAYNKKL